MKSYLYTYIDTIISGYYYERERERERERDLGKGMNPTILPQTIGITDWVL